MRSLSYGSFKGKTPMEVVCEHLEKTPIWDQVLEDYNLDNERIQVSNYQQDLALRKLKRCL